MKMNGHIEKLAPFDGAEGIKRVSGRFEYSGLFDFDRKHPMILPGENVISSKVFIKGLYTQDILELWRKFKENIGLSVVGNW